MNVSTVATLKMKAVETKRKSRRSTLCQTIPGDGLVSFSNASSLNKRETLADMSDDAIEKLKKDGYAIIPNFLSNEEINLIKQESKAFEFRDIHNKITKHHPSQINKNDTRKQCPRSTI